MNVIPLHKPDLTIQFTEAERWALTKSILLTLKVQDGTFDPEDIQDEDTFTSPEHQPLFSALEKLNQAYREQKI